MSQFIEMFGTVEDNTHNFPIMTIGEFANCFAGATPSTSHPEYWENGKIRWMSSGEVHKGHVEDTDSRITELGYKSASTRMVPIHSIVIALAGQGKTRGTVAVTEVDLCTNQSLCAIVPDERVNYSYLYHNLQVRYLELRGLSGDVNGRGGLNLKIIQKIPVILPPIDKQQQFAAIAQQADKSKFGDFKSQFIEMFGNPTNETVGKLGNELFSFASGKANIKSNLDPSFQYNCYGGNGITGKSKEYLLKDKTIVIGRVGEYCGCVHQTSDYCWVTDNAIYLKTYSDIYRFKFIYYMFVMMDFHRYASETGQPKITQAPLLSCTYPIPTLEAQDIFISIAEQADKSKSVIQKALVYLNDIQSDELGKIA